MPTETAPSRPAVRARLSPARTGILALVVGVSLALTAAVPSPVPAPAAQAATPTAAEAAATLKVQRATVRGPSLTAVGTTSVPTTLRWASRTGTSTFPGRQVAYGSVRSTGIADGTKTGTVPSWTISSVLAAKSGYTLHVWVPTTAGKQPPLGARYARHGRTVTTTAYPGTTCPKPHGTVIRASPATVKTVALTFDDGPSEWTPHVLDILAAHGVRATFFVIGVQMEKYPHVARRLVAEGHVIANHTYTHPQAVKGSKPYGRFDTLPAWVQRDQLDRTTSRIKSTTGVTPCFFRGPGGWHNSTTTAYLTRQRGMSVVGWNHASGDYASHPRHDPARISKTVAGSTANPGKNPVILFHDGPSAPVYRGNTANALPSIIKFYKDRGYAFTDPAGRKLPTGVPR